MRWVLGYASALCVLILIVSQSVIFPTFFMPFFRWQYRITDENGLNTADIIGMEMDDLLRVTREKLEYMRGRRGSMVDITAEVWTTPQVPASRVYGESFFTPLEIRHMEDVLDLYTLLFIVRNVAFFVLVALVLGMILLRVSVLPVLAKCCREVLAGFLILVFITGIVIAIDFERAWNVFHLIFFNNDYWMLNPRVDLQISMVPLRFFIHISIFVGGLALVACGGVITWATLHLRQRRGRL